MNLQKGCRGSPNHRGARAQAHRGVPRRHRFNVATIQCQPAGRLLGLIVSTLRPRRCKVLQTKPRQASWSLTPGCILMPPASASILPRVLALGPSCAPLRRSSNANSLCGRNSAGSREICATFQVPQCHGAWLQRAISRHNDSAGICVSRSGEMAPLRFPRSQSGVCELLYSGGELN